MLKSSTSDWPVDVPTGYRIGDWQVGAGIAAGSWGAVYAAERVGGDPALPQRAALKFLPTGTLTPRSVALLRAMAERESRAGQVLLHPHVIRTHTVLAVDDPARPDLDGSTVLVLDRADCSVQDLLDAHPGRPVPDGGRLLSETAHALAHVHAQRLVHADLKPSNLLLTTDRSIRLADFGLAAELEGTHAYLPPVGTPDYLPPEYRGAGLSERGRAVRPAADVWAYGVLCFRLLTGRWPFRGDSPAARSTVAGRYAGGEWRLLDADLLPPEWRDLVRACLDPDPHRRPTMAEVVRRLPGAAARPRRRRWVALGAAAVAAVVVTVIAVQACDRPQVPVAAASQWREVFRDDFDESALDPGRWWGPYSEGVYDPDHVAVAGGSLVITGQSTSTSKGVPFGGGVMASFGASRVYGRYEARYRVDPSACLKYSIALWPQTSARYYARLATDENVGRTSVTQDLIIDKDGVSEYREAHDVVDGDFTGWHTVGVDWEPGSLAWFVDGQEVNRYTGPFQPTGDHSLAIQLEPMDLTKPCGDNGNLYVDWVAVSVRN